MRKLARSAAAAALVALGLAACSKKLPESSQTAAPPAPAPAAAPAPAPGAPPAAVPAAAPIAGAPAAPGEGGAITGKVVETMDAASYTYVRVNDGKRTIWAAAPKFDVKVGDTVTVPEGMPMENYRSETLKRDFDLVYFVASIGKGGAPPAGAPPAGMPGPMMAAEPSTQPLPEGMHPKVDSSQAAKDAGVSFAGIKKADKTVADIFAAPASLGGKEVAVRGKVVKFNAQIMGKNWIHLQDGTGAAGSNDLTITTNTEAKVGDTVLVRGKVTVDKDFGMGYRYGVIMEDAAVSVE